MILGLVGAKGSGKDLTAKIIKEEADKNLVFAIKKFAGKLKEISAILLDCNPQDFEKEEFKNSKAGDEWGDILIRNFLQTLGTDILRKWYDNIWITGLLKNYSDILDNWIISDVRFINEAKGIREKGGKIILINRPGLGKDEHISEQEYKQIEPDYIIDNTGSIEELRDKVIEILKKEEIYVKPESICNTTA